MELLERIQNKTAKVAIIGLGYVGLPLAVEIAAEGFDVTGFELDAEKIRNINEGISYISDVESDTLKRVIEKGLMKATEDFSMLGECQIVVICVPTPLDRFKQPDLSFIDKVTDQVKKYMQKGTLVILESTTYPGTTEEILKPAFESSGQKVGEDFFLVFSPERVDPGNKIYRTKNIPKIVGGCSEKCATLAKAFYGSFLEAPVHIVSSPKEAEMTKIYENTFRVVNCALANEMAIICSKLGINIWEVIDAASTKPFGFMPFYPGPGVGGHCIPIDPFYLSYRARAVDSHTRFKELAGEINDAMPAYVASRITDLLNSFGKPVKGSKILLMGISYKADIDDLRESPALAVWDILEAKGAKVFYHDPYCPLVKRNGINVPSVALVKELVESCDVVVITAAHKTRVNYEMIKQHAKAVLDTKNMIMDKEASNVYLL